MKLNEYLELMDDGDELTVWDTDYDSEVYFYVDNNPDEDDKYQQLMNELSKILTVTKICANGVTVNLSEVINKKIDKLKEAELFIKCNLDHIMDDMDNIISGYVSEEWLKEFINVLKED